MDDIKRKQSVASIDSSKKFQELQDTLQKFQDANKGLSKRVNNLADRNETLSKEVEKLRQTNQYSDKELVAQEEKIRQ